MKKNLLWAALVGVAFTGCVSDESTPLEGNEKMMKFGSPVFKTQSRAIVKGEILNTTYPETEKFHVYAYSYTGAYNGENQLTTYFNVNGEDAVKKTSYWETDNPHYWPDASHNMMFAAYSPADLEITDGNLSVSHLHTTGLKIENFRTQANSDDQYDLMYSNRAYDLNSNNNGTKEVDLTFNHALSSIVFSASRGESSSNIQITGIKIEGTFIVKGDFNQNVSKDETVTDRYVEKSEPTWTNTATAVKTIDSGTHYSPGLTPFNVTTTPTIFTSGISAMLLIPQTIPNDARVTIEYTSGSTSLPGSATVYFKDFVNVDTSADEVDRWEIGKRYIYRFQFGNGKLIYFNPSVENWVSGGTLYTDIAH